MEGENNQIEENLSQVFRTDEKNFRHTHFDDISALHWQNILNLSQKKSVSSIKE